MDQAAHRRGDDDSLRVFGDQICGSAHDLAENADFLANRFFREGRRFGLLAAEDARSARVWVALGEPLQRFQSPSAERKLVESANANEDRILDGGATLPL